VSHGENLRVLIFGENASEAESLASLLKNSGQPLQSALVNETGRPGMALATAHPDILICGVRDTSPDYEPAKPATLHGSGSTAWSSYRETSCRNPASSMARTSKAKSHNTTPP